MNAIEYKKYHEANMQNNHGSTAFHTVSCIFFTVQCSIYISVQPRRPTSSQYIYEYFIMILPMILAHTVLAEHIYVLNLAMLTILSYQYSKRFENALKKLSTKNIFKDDKMPFISSLRGLTYLITVCCILAVDFKDFPRYLAKTERFGYSLMDTGVGLFVCMSGIVHKDTKKNNLKDIIKSHLKVILILLLLGVGRFISVKQLDYQEHVTEYGVHWNFFFTIAVCKLVSTVLLCIFNNVLLASTLCLVIHELLLYIGLQDWVFSDAPRDSFISANREGISSCLGYVSIYLFAFYLRLTLLNKNKTKHQMLITLTSLTVIMLLLSHWDVIRPTSRTLANAGYSIFINAILMTITTVKYLICVLYEEANSIQVPLILSTINTNGLSYFLIANLLTGAINLSIRTLLVSSTTTFVVLNVYMIVTIIVIVCLKKIGFKI